MGIRSWQCRNSNRPKRKIGDRMLTRFYNPPDVIDIPDYEARPRFSSENPCQNRRSHRSVVVGVGSGVTCVIAAIATQAKRGIRLLRRRFWRGRRSLRRVARVNKVLARTEGAFHAIVAVKRPIRRIRKCDSNRGVVHPSDLPPCDILELLGLRGAENLHPARHDHFPQDDRRRNTHGFLGAPTEKVRDLAFFARLLWSKI